MNGEMDGEMEVEKMKDWDGLNEVKTTMGGVRWCRFVY